MPQVKQRLDAEFNCDAKLSDPDQCVAKGAAIYAMNAAYSQAMEDYEEGNIDERPAPIKGPRARVVNVTSKTYGTDCNDSNGNPMVKNLVFANTSLPTKVVDTFTTGFDNQRQVSMKVFESDFTNPETEDMVEERFCTMLEDRVLQITQNWPKGTRIDVVFEVDNEGILHVHANVGQEAIDFTLKINGVKSREELDDAIAAVAKISVE